MTNQSEIQLVGFAGSKLPAPFESKEKNNDKYISWGEGEYYNQYPNFLLKLYNDSPIHSAIIDSKANYIIGNGLKLKNGAELNIKVNAADTMQEFLLKVVKDYLIFNAFAVEVEYNVFKQPIGYNHVPLHRVRTNNNKTKFWVAYDWAKTKHDYVFDRFKAKLGVNDTPVTRLFYFDGYTPSTCNVYPTPDYNGALKSILTDIDLKDFIHNNVNNHFSVSSIISFHVPSPSDEIKKATQKTLESSYTGAKGKKMIMEWVTPDGKAAEVKNLTPNGWDKEFESSAKRIIEDIMIGHQVVSPMLFGVKTEGQLGGSTELETAYEIFKENYVRVKRNDLEGAFNMLFAGFEAVKGELEFADKQLFNARISEPLKEKIYTINELRKEAGLPPIQGGDRLIGEPAPVQQPTQMSADAIVINLTDEDFEKIKELGVSFEQFDFIEEGEFVTSQEEFKRIQLEFELMDEVSEYLLKNDVSGMSLNEVKALLRKELGVSMSNDELQKIFKQLTKAGVVKVDVADGKVSVSKPDVEEPGRKIETMYSYEVRPKLGAPIEDNTRPFCRKLIENNRLYTREDIQTMASIFGYDVFKYGGGYYHNPKTGETTTHCRHQFKQRIVTRKKR